MTSIGTLVALLCLIVTPAQAWDCYDAQPTHPTAEEKIAFIKEISGYATKAEIDHGVPAAGLTAMALVESGYGWTRTALNANNIFGWKYYSKNAAGDRDSWALECQPAEDVGNNYVVFKDRADAVDFVAMKLATLKFYKEDRTRYLADRVAGVEVKTATDRWVEGISSPYNWKPAAYTRTLVRLMNDPLSPSDVVSPKRNLYQLAKQAVTSSSPTPDADLAKYAQDVAKKIAVPPSGCDAPDMKFPGYEGYPVTRCDYSDSGSKTVQARFLNPDQDRLGRWLQSACRDAKASEPKKCVEVLARRIMTASSIGWFPVSGFIVEPLKNGMYCFLFRDGVTVATNKFDTKPVFNNGCPEDLANDPPARAKKFARIASTTREEFMAAGGTKDVGTSDDQQVQWLTEVRREYLKAWDGDRNFLIYAAALSEMKKGTFK